MGKRKIIQVTTGSSQTDHELYALCDDGTLWVMSYPSPHEHWQEIPPIPQPEEDK